MQSINKRRSTPLVTTKQLKNSTINKISNEEHKKNLLSNKDKPQFKKSTEKPKIANPNNIALHYDNNKPKHEILPTSTTVTTTTIVNTNTSNTSTATPKMSSTYEEETKRLLKQIKFVVVEEIKRQLQIMYNKNVISRDRFKDLTKKIAESFLDNLRTKNDSNLISRFVLSNEYRFAIKVLIENNL